MVTKDPAPNRRRNKTNSSDISNAPVDVHATGAADPTSLPPDLQAPAEGDRPPQDGGPPFAPLPPGNPPALFVARSELAPLNAALEQLATDQPHPLLFVISGTEGAGKSSTLREIATRAEGIPLLVEAFPLVGAAADAVAPRSNTVQHILLKIGQRIGAAPGEQVREQPSQDTLIGLAREIRVALDANPALRLVLTFDLDDSDAARGILRALEEVLFTQLIPGDRQRYPVIIVVASRHPLRWHYLAPEAQVIVLEPFDLPETEAQLGASEAAAVPLVAATAGLTGANARLWHLRADQKDRGPAALFERVYYEFVAPLLGDDPLLARTIAATALLDKGFDVTEFMTAVRQVSYMRGHYTTESKAFYFSEIARIYDLGLLRFDNHDGKYHMEPHIAALLGKWNAYRPDAAANRELVAASYKRAPVAPRPPRPTVPSPALASPPASPAPTPTPSRSHRTAIPAAPGDLTAPHEDILGSAAEATSPPFVGRDTAIREIADYLCRRSTQQVDIVFVQGGAGTGKTELIRHFLKRAQQAAYQYPASGLLVPISVPHVGSATAFQEDADTLSQTGLIDLEFSAASQLGMVRRTIRQALIQALCVEREITFHTLPPAEQALLEEEIARDFFVEYDNAHRAWREMRDQLPHTVDPAARRALVQQERAAIGQLQHRLEQEFYMACRKVAVESHPQGIRRRILLVFDTYDYPVRSGLSARQFIAQIAAQLAGDYFFLIACRPPIEAERRDPYINGDLRKFLPDDLREQAAVLNLDEDSYGLTVDQIRAYYAAQSWYQAALTEDLDFQYRGTADTVKVGELVDRIARFVYAPRNPALPDQHRRGGLPVLLSLLEYYVGLYAPSPAGEPRLVYDPYDLYELSDVEFQHDLAAMLLRNVPGPLSHQPAPAYVWALQLMSVIDRGVSRELLDHIHPILAAQQLSEKLPTADQIWNAMTALAGSTMLKQVQTVLDEPAFKLHDYVSTLFNHYTALYLQDRPIHEPVAHREQIIQAVWDYVFTLGTHYRPDPQQQHAGRDERAQRSYRVSRSNLVYYGLRLAAIQQDDEAVNRRVAAPLGLSTCLPHPRPDDLARFSSGALKMCLTNEGQPLLAAETARLVAGYLCGKVTSEVSEYAEYGFAEMLLQEVRYYIYDQGGEDNPVANLTLPLVEAMQDESHPFWSVACLYYAAMLTWEQASAQFATADPWLLEQGAGPATASVTELRPWRQDWYWRQILALVTPDDATPDRAKAARHAYHRQYADWLRREGYATRAHDAYARLAAETSGAEYVHLQVEKAEAAIANPRESIYRSPRGQTDIERKGLYAAEAYLHDALQAARRPNISPAVLGRVHHTFGFLYRLLDRLAWATDPTMLRRTDHPDPTTKWGALRHYWEALTLLANPTEPRAAIDYATALNGHSYVLTLRGEVHAATTACTEGIAFLQNLLTQLRDPGLQRQAEDALGRAYSTLGEIALTRARARLSRRELPNPDVRDYEAARDAFENAARHFESTNREWTAQVEAGLAYARFWIAYNSPPTDPPIPDLLNAAAAFRRTLITLLLKDRPLGYRRLGHLLTKLADLNVPLPDEPGLVVMDAATKAFADTLQAPTPADPRNYDTARQAFIYMNEGYHLAQDINDQLTRYLLSTEAVELLARYTDADTACAFYDQRRIDLKLDEENPQGYREGLMVGRAHLALAEAYLRQAAVPTAAATQQANLTNAVEHLVKGYSRLKAVSIGDWVYLNTSIATLRKYLHLFDEATLGQLYGDLQPYSNGAAWRDMLEAISLQLIRRNIPQLNTQETP